MKHSRIFRKTVCLALIACLLAGCSVMLFACNKDKDVKITDIFKKMNSYSAFTGYELEFTLPAGWSVYTASNTSSSASADSNSDVGYIKELNAFVVKDAGNRLSIMKCSDDRVYYKENGQDGIKGLLFPMSLGISAMRIKNGLIAVKFDNGQGGVFDYNGRVMVSRDKIGGILNGENSSKAIPTSTTIDNALKILDGGLVAVHANFCEKGANTFTSIYRPAIGGGSLVCRVKNDANNLSYVQGFDSKYVSVIGNTKKNYMFAIPQSANGEPRNLDGSGNGTVADNSKSNYFCEITYIGGGKFFVHEDWTASSSDDYTYYSSDGKYYVVSRHIYTPDNDAMTDYTANSDKIFLSLSNKYYDHQKNGIDTRTYLNDGYMYAAYGLFLEEDANGKKIGYYDQYILDMDLNIVMSLTGNFGVTIKEQEKDEVGFFDMIMTNIDGYFYVPYLPSGVNIYDEQGKLVGSNKEHKVLSQNLSNGVLLAQIQDPDDDNKTLFGAFDLKGNVLIDFKYEKLTAFRGFYALGQRKNDDGVLTNYLVDRYGKEVAKMSDYSTPFADIAKSTAGESMFKVGCYMFKTTSNSETYFGIKNFDANSSNNVIMSATMEAGSILYSPANSAEEVFVFEKITAQDKTVSYTVYRIV